MTQPILFPRYAVKRLWTYRNDDDRTTGWQVVDLGCLSIVKDGRVEIDYNLLSQVHNWDYVTHPTFGNKYFVIKGFGSLEREAADSLAKKLNEDDSSHSFFELMPAQLKELEDKVLDPV